MWSGFIFKNSSRHAGKEEAIRVAAVDLEADIRYLTTVWQEVQEQKETAASPAVLYREPDLPQRMLRDFASSDTRRIVIDNARVHEELLAFSKRFVSDPQPAVR